MSKKLSTLSKQTKCLYERRLIRVNYKFYFVLLCRKISSLQSRFHFCSLRKERALMENKYFFSIDFLPGLMILRKVLKFYSGNGAIENVNYLEMDVNTVQKPSE